MPKLSNDMAKKVDTAEDGFKPVEPGWYQLKLVEVDTGEGAKGPYWQWVFRRHDSDSAKRFWETTSLSEEARWRLRKVFEAFEVPTDTNTDDLLGLWIWAELGIKTIQKGTRAGELDNTIVQFKPQSHKIDDTQLGSGKPFTPPEGGASTNGAKAKAGATAGKGGDTEPPPF